MSNLTAKDKLSAARLKVRERAPYIQAALFGLVVMEAKGLGTIGVTENGFLMVDFEAVEKWSVDETAAALFHEVWHILRDHHGRGRACGANPKLFNIAGDAEINDDLREGGWAVGKDWVFPESVGCAEGLTAEEYYAHVRANMQCAKCGKPAKLPDDDEADQIDAKNKQDSTGQGDDDDGDQDGHDSQSGSGDDGDQSDGSSDGDGDGDESGDQPGDAQQGGGSSASGSGSQGGHCQCNASSGVGSLGNTPGQGWCGSAAGRKLPGEPPANANGENPNAPRGRSEAELNRMRREVARSAQEHSEKSRGTVPGGILRWACDHLAPPRIRWQDKLARFTRSAVAYRAGAVDYKYERPSRRQYGMGFGFGKPVLPCMRQPVPNVLVVVDTSGSMGTDELKTALQETNGVLQQTGAKVQFMSCDAAVHGLGEVRSWRDMLPLLKGGGGTSFCPAFEALPKCKPRPDVLIFVTDGMGDAPAVPPPGVKVIWLLVGPHKQRPYFGSYGDSKTVAWGDMIFMEDEIIKEELEGAA